MTLRKITEHDTVYLVNWRNTNAQFFPPGPPLTRESHSEWYYEQYIHRPWDHMYMVCDPYKLGTVAIDIRSKTIHRVMRGTTGEKGAMSRALVELLNLYGPGTYALQVIEGNEHAIRFYEALGFRRGGRQRGSGDCMMVNMFLEWR